MSSLVTTASAAQTDTQRTEDQQLALTELTQRSSGSLRGSRSEQVLTAQTDRMSASLTETCYLMKVSLNAGFGTVKLPSELTKGAKLTEVYKENGVKEATRLPIFQVNVSPSLVKEFLPNWNPKIHDADEVAVGTTWARHIVQTRLQYLRDKLFSPVSKELGWLFSERNIVRINDELEQLRQLAGDLVRLLTDERVYGLAKEQYENRVNTVIREICEARPTNEDPDLYIDELAGEFPADYQIRNAFRLITTPPEELPSVASRLEGNADIAKAIAGQMESDSKAALAKLKGEGLQSLMDSVSGQAEVLKDELTKAVVDSVRRIRESKHTENSSSRIEEIAGRIDAIRGMLSGLTGDTDYEQIATLAERIAETYTSREINTKEPLKSDETIELMIGQIVDVASESEQLGDNSEAFLGLQLASTETATEEESAVVLTAISE